MTSEDENYQFNEKAQDETNPNMAEVSGESDENPLKPNEDDDDYDPEDTKKRKKGKKAENKK